MGTRQTFKTVDVLRLEVEETPTGLVNQILNPPDTSRLQNPASNVQGDGWGWVGNESALSSQFFVVVPTGRTDAWVSWAMLNGAPNSFFSEDWAQVAGEYAAARLVGATFSTVVAYVRLRFEWLDGNGVVIGSSAQSGYTQWTRVDTTGGVVQSLSAQQAPAGTVRARLRLDFYGSTLGTNSSGGTVYLKEVTAAKAATAAELAGLGYIPAEPTWVDVIGPTHTITVQRSELNVGTLTAEILDAAIDPSQSTLVRPGKRVRLMALDHDTAAWSPLFDGRILRGKTTYDARRSDAKRARVTLTAVDAVAQLSQFAKTLGVTEMQHLWRPLEGAHVPYWLNVNGWPATTQYTTQSRSLLDQIGIVRDSELGYAWVNRKGLLQLWQGSDLPTAVAATLDESTYSDLAVDYDTDRCINVVNLKLRLLDGAGEEIEVQYGPFADQASVDIWGAHAAEFTVVGITNSAQAAEAYAAPILAANATPAVRINSVEIPIRDAADIVAGKAFIDLYDLVTVSNANAAISEGMRPTGLEHRIEDGKWILHLDFAAEGGVAPPQQTAALATVTGDTGWLRPGDSGGPTWGAGWADLNQAAYENTAMHRVGTKVRVVGVAARSAGTSTTILTLPDGCRPKRLTFRPCRVVLSWGELVIDTAGNVSINLSTTAYSNGQAVCFEFEFETDQPAA